MTVKPPIPLSDLRGYSRLAVDATIGVTDIVETVHANILRFPGLGAHPTGRTRGITGLVYHNIRGTTRLVGVSLDALLALLDAAFEPTSTSAEREALLAAVNGVLGDHLAASANPLAIAMRLRRDGEPLDLTMPALAAAIPPPSGKVLVLVHGLCMSDLQCGRAGGATITARRWRATWVSRVSCLQHGPSYFDQRPRLRRGAGTTGPPPGPSRSRNCRSSATGEAVPSPAAPVTTASLPGMRGHAICARLSSWARRTMARRLSGAATG